MSPVTGTKMAVVIVAELRRNRMNEFLDDARNLFEYTRSLRRDFHRYPELGFQEVRTAGIVARELNELGLEVTTGIAETGVVALLEGGSPGPVVLLRFDMDALPIQEETDAEYASQNPGVMHACGHDAHTAVGLTVARLLHLRRDRLPGIVKFVFQPAEEGLGGAERMVQEGVLENPEPDVALALHIWNEEPVGWVGVSQGAVMAAAELFTIRIEGDGGHAASPHTTRDPILAAAQVISAVQSIASRNVHPLESAVVSITQVRGGEAFNVIPAVVELKGTIRTFQPDIRELVLDRFHTLVRGVSQAMGCRAGIEIHGVCPAVVNDPGIAARVQAVVREMLGEKSLETDYRLVVSEDMSLMMQDIPGCYFFVGSANDERSLNAFHHHPRFDFDESVLPQASALMAAAAVKNLQSLA